MIEDALLKRTSRCIRIRLQAMHQAELVGRYLIGQHVAEVIEADKEGSGLAIKQLAEYLNVYESDLYKWWTMANAWSLEEIKRLAIRRTCTDELLEIQHFELLASINGPKKRERLLERCFKKDLMTSQLARLIQQR